MEEKQQISLYIHIPFCMKKCDYCDFLSGVYDEEIQSRYTDSLCQEIRFLGRQFAGTEVYSVYIGGGTPTWLNQIHMERIIKELYQDFSVSEKAEVSMECNPGTVTFDKLRAYRQWGINRLSIGLQSANPQELQCLGRVHTYERFLHTYEMARKAGFDNVNVDIMTGLPGQTLETLMETLTRVIQLRPEHISAYGLMVEEGTPFYDRYKFDSVKQHAGMETEFLPNEDEEYRLYKMTQQVLQSHGYLQYEISNYARAGYACEHNIVYWVRRPYLGMGLGASSLLGNVRGSNVRDIYAYMDRCEALARESSPGGWPDATGAKSLPEAVLPGKESDESDPIPVFWNGRQLTLPLWDQVQQLSRKEEMEEFMFLGLRMNQGIKRWDFERYFGCNIDGIYGGVLKKLRSEGMLQAEAGRIFLTDQGRDLSNYVLAEFLF